MRLARAYHRKWIHAERNAVEAHGIVAALEEGFRRLNAQNALLNGDLRKAHQVIAFQAKTVQGVLSQRDDYMQQLASLRDSIGQRYESSSYQRQPRTRP